MCEVGKKYEYPHHEYYYRQSNACLHIQFGMLSPLNSRHDLPRKEKNGLYIERADCAVYSYIFAGDGLHNDTKTADCFYPNITAITTG